MDSMARMADSFKKYVKSFLIVAISTLFARQCIKCHFFPAEVRVILLRECEKKGKKLLFDSQSVERQSLKVTAAAKLLRMSFESIL